MKVSGHSLALSKRKMLGMKTGDNLLTLVQLRRTRALMALTQRAQPSMCLPILSGGNSGTYLLDYIILYTSPTRDGGGGSFYGRIRTFCFPNNLLVDKKIGLFKK